MVLDPPNFSSTLPSQLRVRLVYASLTSKPESTERRLWGQSLKKPEGAPLNLG